MQFVPKYLLMTRIKVEILLNLDMFTATLYQLCGYHMNFIEVMIYIISALHLKDSPQVKYTVHRVINAKMVYGLLSSPSNV